MTVYGGVDRYSVEITSKSSGSKLAWIGFAEDYIDAVKAAMTLLRCYMVDSLTTQWPDNLVIEVTKNRWIIHFEDQESK